MRFLILILALVLFDTNEADAACGSASGRPGLLAKVRVNRQARIAVRQTAESCQIATVSACR